MKKSDTVLVGLTVGFIILLAGIFIGSTFMPKYRVYPQDFAETTLSESPYSNGKLNINLAGVEELMILPGIGEETALRIIEYREQHGPFQSIDGLLRVKGIGASKLDDIRQYITVDD